MPPRKKNTVLGITEGRTTRSRSKIALQAENGLQRKLSPARLKSYKIQRLHTKTNGQLHSFQTCTEMKQLDNPKTSIKNVNQNGSLLTDSDEVETNLKLSQILLFTEMLSRYKAECICYIYISLTWMSHHLILQNKLTNKYINVNYILDGHILWSLMIGTVTDLLSVNTICFFKNIIWLLCIISSFTISEVITEASSRSLLCSSLLVSQIVLSKMSNNNTTSLCRLSAVRCLLDYHRVIVISVLHRIRVFILDFGSYFNYISSELFVDHLMFLCLSGGAILCLSCLSKCSTANLISDKPCSLRKLVADFICKICVTIPWLLFLYNNESSLSIYSSSINSLAIGINLFLFPLISLLFDLRLLLKIGFFSLAAIYSFMKTYVCKK